MEKKGGVPGMKAIAPAPSNNGNVANESEMNEEV